ncbi:MAG: glycogen debranching protein GlgX [Armatimonadia bacterium]|nr:glycogen debranching protein GlgX [Armatimonadia bacterium]
MENIDRQGAPAGVEQRIDVYPTHRHGDFRLRPGRPFPFGATLVPGGVNFSVYSSSAQSCTLVLFRKGERQPYAEIPFPDSFRIGHVWCMIVFDLDYEDVEYGYRMNGPGGPGHAFNPQAILLDPFAKAISGRDVWGAEPDWDRPAPYRGRLVYEDFDWEDDRPLEIPIEDLVVYEAHVRGLTAHESSGSRHPGTFAALREKIPYLKDLGVNCIELMPIFEFDEWENSRQSPITGETLFNYWGYSTVGFFAPKTGLAATGKMGMQVDELKTLVKALHAAGIEVLLDVVFNHTAEGNEMGPTISFRGIDNSTYYMLTPEGYYFNFSGCGNTLNCNNPVVRQMVLDCLRYWAADFHIDGFRFDLAAILGRDPWGAPLPNPPLLESLAFDPILGKCKLIAEAWDAGGLYQVGSFPAYGRWAEWNGKFRDDARCFLKGDEGTVGAIAKRVSGSPDLYGANGRGPTASINFITCHDGFTLHDLLAYNEKHNEANDEDNRDGESHNDSWNCGAEGETDDPGIIALRHRLAKNAFTLLLTSHGIPMILMGDDMLRTQQGNNNTYCQDNDLNWLDWSLLDRNADIHRFAANMIALRQAHPSLRPRDHMNGEDHSGAGYPDLSWHGAEAWQPDWSDGCRLAAWMIAGPSCQAQCREDDFIYVAMNSSWQAFPIELPGLPEGRRWHMAVNTALATPDDIHAPGDEVPLDDQGSFLIGDRSAIVLIGK